MEGSGAGVEYLSGNCVFLDMDWVMDWLMQEAASDRVNAEAGDGLADWFSGGLVGLGRS